MEIVLLLITSVAVVVGVALTAIGLGGKFPIVTGIVLMILGIIAIAFL